ncbi:hypothetical protein QVD99_003995 [Batrachochytrium dendrobatidis]|nr:hypothetical protein O5D80_002272 [Batrachochytrium dendrobatidis]KAK5669604.1 hypothetical protein QVD99_003995 [Batrachochytrium dendrobatidis]
MRGLTLISTNSTMAIDYASTKRALNLSVLRRHDPLIESISETSSHVTVYSFESRSQTWTKRGIEGTIFVYQRSIEPRNAFVIMNRLSTENLVVPLTNDLQFEMLGDYLIYRLPNDSIVGLWIFEPSDRQRLAVYLSELAQQGPPRRPYSQEPPQYPIASHPQLPPEYNPYPIEQFGNAPYQQHQSPQDVLNGAIQIQSRVSPKPHHLQQLNQKSHLHSHQPVQLINMIDIWNGIDHMGPVSSREIMDETEFYARVLSLVRDPFFAKALYNSYQMAKLQSS